MCTVSTCLHLLLRLCVVASASLSACACVCSAVLCACVCVRPSTRLHEHVCACAQPAGSFASAAWNLVSRTLISLKHMLSLQQRTYSKAATLSRHTHHYAGLLSLLTSVCRHNCRCRASHKRTAAWMMMAAVRTPHIHQPAQQTIIPPHITTHCKHHRPRPAPVRRLWQHNHDRRVPLSRSIQVRSAPDRPAPPATADQLP